MQPLKITAQLVDGFVASDQWSPSIDGILGYQQVMNQLGPDEFAMQQGSNQKMRTVIDLPLRVVEHGDIWWYACSLPLYKSAARMKKHFHRRFDQQHSDKIDFGKKSGKVLVQAGPYKNYRRSIFKTLTSQISWHVVGEEVEIKKLLGRTTHIGGKCAQGYGEVRKWVVDEGIEDVALYRRAVPLEYAEKHEVEGLKMRWGIRPPARLPENQYQCVIPS